MRSPEPVPLYRRVRPERHQHGVLGGEDGMRCLGAAETAQQRIVRGVAVVERDVVVGTLLVRLQLERVEHLRKIKITICTKCTHNNG